MENYNIKTIITIEGNYIVSAINNEEAKQKVIDLINKLNISKLGKVNVDLSLEKNDD